MKLISTLLLLSATAAVVHLGYLDRPLPVPTIPEPPHVPEGVLDDYLIDKNGNVMLFRCSHGVHANGFNVWKEGSNTIYVYQMHCWGT